jgi:uncharacterized membrane protein YfcA
MQLAYTKKILQKKNSNFQILIPPKYQNMSAQLVVIILLIGLVAGVLSGLVGVGGGIVVVPALIYFLAFSQQQAQGTSLGLLLLPAGILAVVNYYKQGYVDYRVVGVLALGFIVGSFFGSKVALSLPQETVKKIFAIVMLIVSIKMLFLDRKPS